MSPLNHLIYVFVAILPVVLADPICPFPSEEIIFYPDENDCSQFYECYEGKLYRMNCPNGLYWNQEYKTCDYKDDVDCYHVTGAPGTIVDKPDPLCPFPSEKISFFVDPEDCTKYYECFEGNKYIMSCPTGLYWNQDLETCDYRDDVDCDKRDPLCPYPSHEVTFFIYPRNCSKYYECYEGTEYVMDCPSGLYWNQELKTCDYASHVHCNPKT